jgi:hypothetical protein
MKQTTKGGDEYDLLSKARKRGVITMKAGGWKYIKSKMNRRFRRESKVELKTTEE